MSIRPFTSFALGLLYLALTGCGSESSIPEPATTPVADYVGSEACRACHEEAYTDWSGSHHALAMQPATPDTVLARFDHTIAQTTLLATGPDFVARLPDATGEMNAFKITHTFGVTPLQQYLVDLGDGKKQVLRASWDSRTSQAGGQRWYEQFPDEVVPPGDVLHWTSVSQNWNSMCGDCHSTGFVKGYDEQTQSFSSQWQEISVGCEACHGPGSAHAAHPQNALSGTAALAEPTRQPEVCAPCHARRAQLAEGYQPGMTLMDFYLPELLNPPLYHPDGQIDDEVYVYGSFKSSKMHQAGVVCGDCHNPHRAAVDVEGDALCAQCHSPSGNPRFPQLKKLDYTRTEHHQHNPDSAGARCVGCHMGSKTYMGVDVRHDHSFRIPTLSSRPNVPLTCQGCHAEQPRSWFAAHLPPPPDHFAAALTAGGEKALISLVDDKTTNTIVRATALSRLAHSGLAGAARVTLEAGRSESDLLRHTSLGNALLLDDARRTGLITRLLSDSVLAVRIEAASAALDLSAEARSKLGPAFASALAEYKATLRLSAETAEAQTSLARVHAAMGDPIASETALERALEINRSFVPALINLADLYRTTGRDADAEPLLKEATGTSLAIPSADQAYALWLVRQGQSREALTYLRRAHHNAPDDPQTAYLLAIGLNGVGDTLAALDLLSSLSQTPAYDTNTHFVHATILRDVLLDDPSYRDAAVATAAALVAREPNNTTFQVLYRQIQSVANASNNS